MSKFGEYIDLQKQRRLSSVEDFAAEMNKTPAALLELLNEAGVKKSSKNDRITEADQKAWLSHLQRSHATAGPRKKITIVKRTFDPLPHPIAEKKNGAEWDYLEAFSKEVIGGHPINADVQVTVNLIIAKAVLLGDLPQRKIGRPKSLDADEFGREVAQEYWDLRDSGSSYEEAVHKVAEEIHEDKRHVMRLVKLHKENIGLTFDERQRKRQWVEAMKSMQYQFPSSLRRSTPNAELTPAPEFTTADFIEYLDERILKSL